MKINLIEEKENPELLAFNTGDILIFYSKVKNDYDYYMVVSDYEKSKYVLLSLIWYSIEKEFNYLNDMIENLNSPLNNYKLIEVIKSEDVELRRTLNG